jgi:hypothetical protein
MMEMPNVGCKNLGHLSHKNWDKDHGSSHSIFNGKKDHFPGEIPHIT